MYSTLQRLIVCGVICIHAICGTRLNASQIEFIVDEHNRVRRLVATGKTGLLPAADMEKMVGDVL